MNFILGLFRSTRSFYLRALNAEALNERFGGPLFLFCAMASSVYVGALFYSETHGLLDFWSGIGRLDREDFIAFYRAGEMAQAGQPALAYDPSVFSEPFSEDNKKLLFLNPPHAFLLFEMLAFLPYPVARGLALLTNLAAIAGLVRVANLRLGLGPYAFTFLTYSVYHSLLLLQISPLVIFLIVFALVTSPSRPVLSGLALALATIKPQYGLLVPVFLLGQKDFRTFLVAAAATAALIGLSVLQYGGEVWTAFLDSASGGATSGHFDQVYTGMITVGQSLGKLWLSSGYRLWGQILILPVCGGWIWYAARSLPREFALPVCLLAMATAAPSFFYYDWLMICAGLLLLVRVMPKLPIHLQLTAGFLWIAPIVQMMVIDQGDVALRVEVARYLSALLPFLTLLVSIQACVLFRKRAFRHERSLLKGAA